MRLMFSGLVTGLLFAAAGCGETGENLIVEVRTDLTAGVDVVTLRATLSAPGTGEVSVPAELGRDLTVPIRLAEFDDLSEGSYELVVTAADISGTPVVSRRVQIDLRESLAVTVALSRSCQGVVCPMAGELAALTTCATGRCVERVRRPPVCRRRLPLRR